MSLSLVTILFGVIPDMGEDLISLIVSLNGLLALVLNVDDWNAWGL